jgi:hypothetical protein
LSLVGNIIHNYHICRHIVVINIYGYVFVYAIPGRYLENIQIVTAYATPNQGEVKLHITLMNSKFKRRKMEKQMCQQELKIAKRKRVKYAFDAQKILTVRITKLKDIFPI